MSLKVRLFITLFFIVTLFILVSSVVYTYNVKNVVETRNQFELEHNKVILSAHFNNLKENLKKIAYEIAKDETLRSSLNLISNYEDPFDYNSEVFDIEKKSLLQHLQKWVKENDKIVIGLFDKDRELVSLHRNINSNLDSGFVSYDEDMKRIFKTLTDVNLKNVPKFSGVNENKLEQFEGYQLKSSYILKYSRAIYLDNKKVGYVRVGFNINEDELKFLNVLLNNKAVLKLGDNKFIFQNEYYKEKFQEIQRNKNFELIPISIFDYEADLEALFIIDGSDMQSRLNKIYIEMAIQWFIGLIILFLLSYKFTIKYVLKPLEKLKTVLEKMKHNEFEILNVKSNDEVGQILKDVNELSQELKQNILLLDNYKAVMDESLIITIADINGIITFANDNFEKASGYSKDDVIGKNHSVLKHPDTPKETFKTLWETISAKKVWKGVIKNKKKGGGYYWVNIIIKPILDTKGEISEYIAVRHDITELMEQKDQLRTMLHTDSLIGLPNRRQLNLDIKALSEGSLAILNIDNFRQVNDFYGNLFGDKLIIELGKIISALLTQERKTTKLYRLDGDEFAILSSLNDKPLFIEKIQNIIRFVEYDTININEETVSVKLTAGISFEDNLHLLQTSGMALQIARKEHKEVIIYSEDNSLNKEYETNIEWTKKIKDAIEEFRVVPFFQPIVQNDSGEITKYEALIRILDKETNKPVSPFFFLDVAKKTKYYPILTKIMLEKTFKTFADRKEEFSINLTIEDVLNKDLQDYIFELLNEYDVGNRTVFEIVESESIENFDEVIAFIKHVKKFGCQIAIDDFGTGYSNFEYLMKLQADYIKIDGSMIKDIDTNENSRLVVETIVSFAKKMGMKTIAEFVENESILKVVNDLGIEYSQGYYFSAPKKELD